MSRREIEVQVIHAVAMAVGVVVTTLSKAADACNSPEPPARRELAMMFRSGAAVLRGQADMLEQMADAYEASRP